MRGRIRQCMAEKLPFPSYEQLDCAIWQRRIKQSDIDNIKFGALMVIAS